MLKSRTNPLIKKARKLLVDPRFREEQQEFVMEGTKIIRDALSSRFIAGPVLRTILFSSGLVIPLELQKLSSEKRIPLVEVSDPLMRLITSLKTAQGIIALSRFVDRPLEEVIPWETGSFASFRKERGTKEEKGWPPFFAGACGIQDPGNLGALIRTAHATSATAVLLFEDCADLYNPKTVRGSMGSLLGIPVVRKLKGDEILPLLKKRGIMVYSTASDGSLPYDRIDFRSPALILFGSEGKGIPASYRRWADAVLSIPMAKGAESLNVNASAAIILYERFRRVMNR